jgi:hypothetical protein
MLFPAVTHAVICKSIDAEGVVSYTDVPADECQQVLKLPDYSRYAPRPIQKPSGASEQNLPEQPALFIGYQSIKIQQPEANGTVRSNEGIVPVSVALEPSLQPGHRIKLFLDGGAVQGEFDSPAIELNGVLRGTHNLRAVISDANGRRLGDSPTVRFTLRKTTIYDRQNAAPPVVPGEPAQPIEPVPENPIEPAPVNPIVPPAGGPSAPAPSGTNPAFAPRYSP